MADYTLSAKITGESEGLKKAAQEGEASLNKLVQQASNVGPVTQRSAEQARLSIEKLGKTIESIGKGITSAGKTISGIGKGLTASITAPVLGLGTAVAKTGIEYKAFKQSSKQAFGVLLGSAEAATEHMDKIMAFAKTTPFAFPDLVSANRKMVAFGMESNKTFSVLEAVSNAVAAMGGNASNIENLSDIFAKIQANGKISREEINRLSDEGINAMAIMANKSGVSMDEMSDRITKGSVKSGDAIDMLVDGIMNGTDGIAGHTAKMGGSLGALKDTWEGAVDSMKGAWRRLGDSVISEDLFAKMTVSVNKVTEIIGKLGPVLSKSFENVFDVITKGINKVLDLANAFLDLDENTQQTILKFVGIAAAAGPVLLLIGNITQKVGGFVTGIGKLIPILNGAGAAAAGPIAAVVAILALLAVAYSRSEDFRNAVSSLMGTLGELAQTLLTALKPAIDSIKTAFLSIADTVGAAMAEILPIIQETIEKMTPVISNIGEVISGIITTIMPIITNLVQQLVPLIQNVIVTFSELSAAITPLMGSMSGSVLPMIAQVIGFLGTMVTAILPILIAFIQTICTVIQALIPIVGAVIGAISTGLEKVMAIASAVFGAISTFIGSIIAVLGNLAQTIQQVIQGAINAVKPAIETIAGLFTSMQGTVMAVFEGIRTGIESAMTFVTNCIKGALDGIQNAWSGLTGFVDGVFAGIGSAVESLVNTVKGFVNGVIGGINGAVSLINMIPGVTVGTIPYLARGTTNWGGGPARMNEGGRGELVVLPGGTQVIPHDVSMKYAKEQARQQNYQTTNNRYGESKTSYNTYSININANVSNDYDVEKLSEKLQEQIDEKERGIGG